MSEDKIIIEIDAVDVLNVYASLQMCELLLHPTEDVKESLERFKIEVHKNITIDQLKWAEAQLNVNEVLKEIFKDL